MWTDAKQILKECEQCVCLQCLAFIFSHTGKLISNIGKKAIGKLPKWLKGPLRIAWNKLKNKGTKFLRETDFGQFITDVAEKNIQGKIKNIVQDFLEDELNDLGVLEQPKRYWMDSLEWIASLDPVS